jgi:hypothetical protein
MMEIIVYDADAHVILAPAMWEDLREKYFPRRPRPATFSDSGDMAAYTSGWLIAVIAPERYEVLSNFSMNTSVCLPTIERLK